MRRLCGQYHVWKEILKIVLRRIEVPCQSDIVWECHIVKKGLVSVE